VQTGVDLSDSTFGRASSPSQGEPCGYESKRSTTVGTDVPDGPRGGRRLTREALGVSIAQAAEPLSHGLRPRHLPFQGRRGMRELSLAVALKFYPPVPLRSTAPAEGKRSAGRGQRTIHKDGLQMSQHLQYSKASPRGEAGERSEPDEVTLERGPSGTTVPTGECGSDCRRLPLRFAFAQHLPCNRGGKTRIQAEDFGTACVRTRATLRTAPSPKATARPVKKPLILTGGYVTMISILFSEKRSLPCRKLPIPIWSFLTIP